MTEYGKCVVMVLERLGLPGASEAYVSDVEALNEAAGEWHTTAEARRFGMLEFDLPDLSDGGPIQTGNLDQADAAGWCKNAAARAFVRYIDKRTQHRSTLLMLQIILLLQQAAQELNPPASRAR